MASAAPQGTGANGFVFEELMDQTLRKLIAPMASKGIRARLLNEQQVRDEFGEQSLNGVDHYFDLEFSDPATHAATAQPMLILIQEKWKQVTNQREVSQFLDCCVRILARLPDYKGKVVRMWVTRTPPSLNGEKSLAEGGAYVVQSSTSMPFLAQETAQFICEILGDRELCVEVIRTMPSLLPSDTPAEPLMKDATAVEKKSVLNASQPAKLKVCVVRKD